MNHHVVQDKEEMKEEVEEERTERMGVDIPWIPLQPVGNHGDGTGVMSAMSAIHTTCHYLHHLQF